MISFICYRARWAPSIQYVHVTRRCKSSLSWVDRLSNPSNQFQIYTSTSRDPYINLSIEHHLFQKSPPGSKVLFQYINRPCIVIGRNQNPWLEVNLALLSPNRCNGRHELDNRGENATGNGLGKIDLVRRRSGGGTVFHDEGNVNWSVICDFTEFTRDKHAEMVVRALRSSGIARARVNERHDIVLDQGSANSNPSWREEDGDTHSTPFTTSEIRPLKVSGSAYKMARNRALHHGTALLGSPNLKAIPRYLHSPARGFIEAKGVESVSSPVSNIGVENDVFIKAVRKHFVEQYRLSGNVDEVVVGDDALEVEDIRKGHDELKSLEWTFLQTPGFTFDSNGSSSKSYDTSRLGFEARHGAILDAKWTPAQSTSVDERASAKLKLALEGVKIHEQTEWTPLLKDRIPETDIDQTAKLLEQMFPSPT